MWAPVIGVVLSALFVPVLLLGGLPAVLVALPLWGIGYATQDTLLKALIAGVLPEGSRSLAFGFYYTAYGAGWLIGSIAIGLLYDRSLVALAVFASGVQLASLPLFIAGARKAR